MSTIAKISIIIAIFQFDPKTMGMGPMRITPPLFTDVSLRV